MDVFEATDRVICKGMTYVYLLYCFCLFIQNADFFLCVDVFEVTDPVISEGMIFAMVLPRLCSLF